MSYRRPRQIFSHDVQQLRGIVSIITARDRVEGTDFFRVTHVSKGGDCLWTNPAIWDEDRAATAAEVLAAFVNAEIRGK